MVSNMVCDQLRNDINEVTVDGNLNARDAGAVSRLDVPCFVTYHPRKGRVNVVPSASLFDHEPTRFSAQAFAKVRMVRAIVDARDNNAMLRAGRDKRRVDLVHGFVGVLPFCDAPLIRDENQQESGVLKLFQCLEHRGQHVKLVQRPRVISRIVVDDPVTVQKDCFVPFHCTPKLRQNPNGNQALRDACARFDVERHFEQRRTRLGVQSSENQAF